MMNEEERVRTILYLVGWRLGLPPADLAAAESEIIHLVKTVPSVEPVLTAKQRWLTHRAEIHPGVTTEITPEELKCFTCGFLDAHLTKCRVLQRRSAVRNN